MNQEQRKNNKRETANPKKLAQQQKTAQFKKQFKDYGAIHYVEQTPKHVLKTIYYTITDKTLQGSKTQLAVAIVNYLQDWLNKQPGETYQKIEHLPIEVLRTCYYHLSKETTRGSKETVAKSIISLLKQWIES